MLKDASNGVSIGPPVAFWCLFFFCQGKYGVSFGSVARTTQVLSRRVLSNDQSYLSTNMA